MTFEELTNEQKLKVIANAAIGLLYGLFDMLQRDDRLSQLEIHAYLVDFQAMHMALKNKAIEIIKDEDHETDWWNGLIDELIKDFNSLKSKHTDQILDAVKDLADQGESKSESTGSPSQLAEEVQA